MNKSLTSLAVIVLVASVTPLTGAGEAAFMCKYGTFARLVKVTPKQEKVMQRILGEMDRKLKSWDEANRARRGALKAALAAARKSRNMNTMCDVLNKKQALQAERTRLADPYMAKLVAQLDTAQRGVWDGELLYREMYRAFNRFRLDEAQTAEIRTRSDRTGLAVAGLRAKGMARQMGIVRRGVAYDIVQDVLTAQQREKFAGSGDAYATGLKETPEQRAERIKLVAIGLAANRATSDIDRTGKVVPDAPDKPAAAGDGRWTVGIASGKTEGASELMDCVNKGRGGAALPGHTQLNFSAQNLADEMNGKDKQNKLTRYYGTTGKGGFWIVGPDTAERAYSAMRSLFDLSSSSYTGLGAGRRGRAWALVFTSK
ncbi:MAG: hypothetical protein ISS78_11415 [Phycisphaerae bacterium]|nr:hypothetical protein [Phycisphaerae bacterium]